ncbi:MAG TPA: di-trans,poly-cis-decaprenylcistransferase [Solibacterales bacterium]|nr:di-trans,poly-cis-decaprenylcistransferase [Bryobacterales bacterium]
MHVAIIMDGNGRWAQARRQPRVAGHKAGADALRRVVEAAPEAGVTILTLYAFSSDNWKRPAEEVNALMRLFAQFLRRETPRCIENGVRVSVIGRRDRLPGLLLPLIEETERRTREGRRLHIRVAVDYAARDQIVAAAAALRDPTREAFAEALGRAAGTDEAAPDVDLLIRTGGEQRLSDFLLWEAAYAELYFTARMWPDFGKAELEAAIADFHGRQRRFGGLPAERAL